MPVAANLRSFRKIIERKIRKLILLILPLFPSILKIYLYRKLFGFEIGNDVKIGKSLIIVDRLSIGDHVRIVSRNAFINTPEISIGSYSTIGNDNKFSSSYEFSSAEGRLIRKNCPKLIIGKHVGISFNHYFDIQDEIRIGDFSTIAGIGSVFFTHGIDIISSSQTTKPITIGKYCMIGSNTKFVPGSAIPDRCVVGMGAVITKKFSEPCYLIGGNPAENIRLIPNEAAYFHRKLGFISSVQPPPFKS